MTRLAKRPARADRRIRVLRVGDRSLVWRPPVAAAAALLLTVLLAIAALGMLAGDIPLSPTEVLAVIKGGGSPLDRMVVMELRLPRLLTAVGVGAALGLSGAVTQSVTRNPLASPDVLGVTAGAGTAAVAVIVLGGGEAAGWLAWLGLPAAALGGGLMTAALVYLLAWRDGVDGNRLILIGIAVGALCLSVTAWLLTRAKITDAAQATVWLTGSVTNRGWEHVTAVAVALLLAGGALFAAAHTLDVLRFTEDTARALGVRLQAGRVRVVVLAVVLAAVATAAAGPVAFVALVAPQLAIRVVRVPGPPLLLSALLGAVLVAGADLAARTLLPVELPVGVLTAVLGAPYLLALLLSQARKVTA
ncbi:iron chelate uptake ABC transporter family permease subunit [Micromonospora sp. NPDC005324]|uniref:FecCD family ABC transporter permease n=1 Tax=Micromonospora sp. NPDC005324 TaxID=3157033 RepID=UPI0033A2A305